MTIKEFIRRGFLHCLAIADDIEANAENIDRYKEVQEYAKKYAEIESPLVGGTDADWVRINYDDIYIYLHSNGSRQYQLDPYGEYGGELIDTYSKIGFMRKLDMISNEFLEDIYQDDIDAIKARPDNEKLVYMNFQPKEVKNETFYIIPKSDLAIEVTSASKEDALIDFTTKMDPDMNQYFMAATKDELNMIREAQDATARKRFVTSFMEDELMGTFDLSEMDAKEVAEEAYEIYCEGNGQTEYECIEAAYDQCMDNRMDNAVVNESPIPKGELSAFKGEKTMPKAYER